MQNHYDQFKENLSKIQIDFKKLLQLQSSKNAPVAQRKTIDAKKVAIMIEKYMDQSPNMLYEIITRNLGKTQISWDDLLKCLQDEFYLSYTVLKRENKKFSISQAKWNKNNQFTKIIQYLKSKQTNYIQSILKPNLGFNISQHSSQCDILAVLLQKQLFFYLIQENRIICSFDFKYRNVRDKLIKKYEAKQVKKQIALRQNQGLDTMPVNEFLNQRKFSYFDSSKNLKNSKKNMLSQSKTQSANSKIGPRSRMNSNASSQISSFMKRNSTDIGVSDWRKKSPSLKDNSVKIRTNTTKKVFELFQNSKLQNSIQIAKKFQQARDSFEKYIVLDKKMLENDIKIDIEDVQLERKNLDFKIQLQKMKQASRNIQKQRKSDTFNKTSFSKQGFYHSIQKTNSKFQNTQQLQNQMQKNNKKNKNIFSTQNRYQKSYTENSEKRQTGEVKVLEDNTIGIVSFSFYENFLLISLYNREVRLYRIKKNLHRLKEELIFQKENESLIIFAQIYKSIFSETYNMVLCSNRNNDTPMMKIYQIYEEALLNYTVPSEKQNLGKDSERSQTINKAEGKHFKEIFSCKFTFNPIYENMNPLGIGAFNQKGYFSIVETNHISIEHKNKNLVKLFQKQFNNLVTGDIVSISACKTHANLINIYFVCKNGFIYLIDKLSVKIKLQKKISQCKILDIVLINGSSQILIVSERGQLMIVNSLNLEQMYFYETYTSLSDDSRLLSIANNKFLFYSHRAIQVIDLEENEEKLLDYQKPLKIYRNRIKIKRQQALLSKETGEIEFKKNMVRLQDNKKSLEFLADEQGRGSNLQKFKSKFNKRRIQQFFSINNCELPHYILVMQNGQVLVYDYKGQYFGSYLKKRHLEIKQALMNKKMYYMAILYKDNSIEVVNLYSQICIVRYPQNTQEEQNTRGKNNFKQSQQSFYDGQEVLCVGFLYSYQPNTIVKAQKTSANSELIFSIDKSLNLSIFNSKGVITKTVDLTQQKIQRSVFSNMTRRRAFSSVYLDKDGDLMIGNEKGDLIFYQKNIYFYMKTIKITYYPIIEIQPLQKSSLISNPKDRNKFILILAANNQLFLLNKENKIYNKIYSPHKLVQQSTFVQKQKNLPLIMSTIKHEIEVNNYKNIKSLENDKVSSVHYLSQIVAFSEHFVVYEWEEIYEKINFQPIESSEFARDQQFNIKKSLEIFVKASSSTKNKQQKGSVYNYTFHTYKRVGYFIEKIKPFKLFQNKMPHRSDLSQAKNTDVELFLKSKNIYFLPIWDTEHYSIPQKSLELRRKNLRRDNWNDDSKYKSKSHQSNQLAYPIELYCFVESTRMTIIIEPQGQFIPEKSKQVQKSESLDKSRRNSRLTSSFISRKNSMESSNISMSFQLNEKSFIGKSRHKQKQKSTIRVYDLEDFLRAITPNLDNNDQVIKVVLQQYI